MSKRGLSIILSLLLVGTSLSGCGKEGGEKGNSENSSVPTTQTEQTSGQEASQEGGQTDTGNGSGAESKLMEDAGTTITMAHNQGEYIYEKLYEMSDKFKELTGITVDWLEIPSSDWETWIQAQFAAGTEPDISWSIPNVKDYFDQGKIVDLTDYYDQENLFNGIIWRDCFKDGALDVTLSSDGTRNIGVAGPGASVSLYYNIDAMEKLGLGTTPPTTYTELFDMMDKAKEDGTYIPMSVMNSMSWNLGWIENDFGDALFNDTDYLEKLDIIVPNKYLDESEILLGLKTGVLRYSDPRYIEYFRLMKEFSKYWNEDFNAASWEYEALFNEGEVLFNYNGGWYPSQVLENGYTVNYGTTVKPYIDKGVSEFGVDAPFSYKAPAGENGMHISVKCEEEGRLSAAVKWLMFYSDKNTGAKMYTDAVLQLPAVKDVILPDVIAGLDNVEYGDYSPKNFINAFKFTPEVTDIYWKAYSMYLDPSVNQNPEDFVKDMEEQLLPYLDEAIEEYTAYDVLSYVDKVAD